MGKSDIAKKVLQGIIDATKPMVREGHLVKNAMAAESGLNQGQKVTQKLLSGNEYAQKMATLRKSMGSAAGIAGVIGASSLMSQEDAQAAGIDTIARKLGVGLEEAAKIKQLAHTAPPNVFEDNIKAIKDVSNYIKNPGKRIGSGMDMLVYDTGRNKVLKEARGIIPLDDHNLKVAPSIVENEGLGPNTKTIQTTNNLYQVQDKVTPLSSIIKASQRPGQDPILEDLYKQSDSLWKKVNIGNPNEVKQINESPEYLSIQKQIENRQNSILKDKGVDANKLQDEYNSLSPDEKTSIGTFDAKGDPETSLEQLVTNQANKKLKQYVQPEDMHSANIGLDKSGNPSIFDTSRFDDIKYNNLKPEMRKKILENYIAHPADKEVLANKLKQAAAIAPITGSDFIQKPANQISDLYKEYIDKPISNVSDAIANKLVDTTSLKRYAPPDAQAPLQMAEDASKPILSGGIKMGLDPLNYINPAAGIAASYAIDKNSTPEDEETQRQLAIKKAMGN